MLEHLIGVIAGAIVATISSLGYLGIVALMAIEFRLHSAAVRNHHAVLGRSGFDRPFRPPACRDRRRDRLQSRLDPRLCRRLLRRPPAGRELGPLYPVKPARSRYRRSVLRTLRQRDRVRCRLLPVVRTFIALPAGIARMRNGSFKLSSVGSWPWCFALAYVGEQLGTRWDSDPELRATFHRFDTVVVGAIVILFVGMSRAIGDTACARRISPMRPQRFPFVLFSSPAPRSSAPPSARNISAGWSRASSA